jgi:hypothetical protein
VLATQLAGAFPRARLSGLLERGAQLEPAVAQADAAEVLGR